MKAIRLLTFLAVIVFTAGFSKQASAQGNLQFNQVINYTIVGSTPFTFTVPAGKVWKIETVAVEYTNTPNVYLRNSSNQILATFYSSASYNNPLPYWLSSGYTGNFFLSNSSTYRGSVSIIEFNVVP
jgi:hypothetical protein